jgi:hypothetical protein
MTAFELPESPVNDLGGQDAQIFLTLKITLNSFLGGYTW